MTYRGALTLKCASYAFFAVRFADDIFFYFATIFYM